SSTTCSAAGKACFCADADFKIQAQACISTSCTVKEALTTQNITTTICDAPIRDRRIDFVASVVFYVLASLTIILRFTSRFWLSGGIWWRDDIVVFVFFVGLPASPGSWILTRPVHLGLGKDLWIVHSDNITQFLKLHWFFEACYIMAVSLLKICFLLFYLRIFQSQCFRYLVWILVVVNAIVAITFIGLLCVTCRPISYNWTSWDGEHPGTCDGGATVTSLANGGISIVLDLVTLGLPISQIWGLQMETKRKIAVISMMSVGLLVTLISTLRLKSLLKLTRTSNPTLSKLTYGRGLFHAALWSVCELNVGTICLCMPALRLLLMRIFSTLGTKIYNSNVEASGLPVKPKYPNLIPSNRDKGVKKVIPDALHISRKRQYGVEYGRRRLGSSDIVLHLVEIRGSDAV
ncbi:hypothetical protein DL98DRAFT_439915, partial [Cadophora sp. DSE1049]